MPTLIASAPASISARAASAVAMLPAITSTADASLIRFTISSTPAEWPCAVSTTSTSTPAATSACARSTASGPTPTAAPARSRPRSSFVASGYSIRFWMSLTVMSPRSRPSASTTGSFSILFRWRISSASASVVPDGRGDEVARRHQRRHRLLDVVLEAEIAVRQDPDEHPVVVGDRDAGDLVPRHQLERLADERGRRQRHRLDDHPRLGALHLVHLGDLLLDGQVAVEDADAALAGERDREPRLRHRVHRSRDDRECSARSTGVSRVRVETSFGSTRDSAGTSSTSSNVSPSFANFRSSATSRWSSSGRISMLKRHPLGSTKPRRRWSPGLGNARCRRHSQVGRWYQPRRTRTGRGAHTVITRPG